MSRAQEPIEEHGLVPPQGPLSGARVLELADGIARLLESGAVISPKA